MNEHDRIAFGSNFTKYAKELGLKLAPNALNAMIDVSREAAIEYIKNRPVWMPPDAQIDQFVSTYYTDVDLTSLMRKTFRHREFPEAEWRMAVNYANRLSEKEQVSYGESATKRIMLEKRIAEHEKAEAVVDFFLFLINKRRIRDGH